MYRPQLTTHQLPGQHADQQRHQDRRQFVAPLQLVERCQRFLGRHGDDDIPVVDSQLPRRGQHLDAVRIDGGAGLLDARDIAVDQRIDTRLRQLFHDTFAIGTGDDGAVARIDQQDIAALAEGILGDLVEEIGFVQLGDAGQRPDHLALVIEDRHPHAEHRSRQCTPHDRRADGRLACLQGTGDIVAIPVIDAGTAGARW